MVVGGRGFPFDQNNRERCLLRRGGSSQGSKQWCSNSDPRLKDIRDKGGTVDTIAFLCAHQYKS